MNFNKNLAKLKFKDFKKFFKRFEGKVDDSPEDVYKSLGGKLPEQHKEGGK